MCENKYFSQFILRTADIYTFKNVYRDDKIVMNFYLVDKCILWEKLNVNLKKKNEILYRIKMMQRIKWMIYQ